MEIIITLIIIGGVLTGIMWIFCGVCVAKSIGSQHRAAVKGEYVTRIDYSDGTHEFCELDENARALAIQKAMHSTDPITASYTTVPRP